MLQQSGVLRRRCGLRLALLQLHVVNRRQHNEQGQQRLDERAQAAAARRCCCCRCRTLGGLLGGGAALHAEAGISQCYTLRVRLRRQRWHKARSSWEAEQAAQPAVHETLARKFWHTAESERPSAKKPCRSNQASSRQSRQCNTCQASPWLHGCDQSPQTPRWHPCLHTGGKHRQVVTWRRRRHGDGGCGRGRGLQRLSAHSPELLTIVSKPPGCSSRKGVTSYTLPSMISQQSLSSQCLRHSSMV